MIYKAGDTVNGGTVIQAIYAKAGSDGEIYKKKGDLMETWLQVVYEDETLWCIYFDVIELWQHGYETLRQILVEIQLSGSKVGLDYVFIIEGTEYTVEEWLR